MKNWDFDYILKNEKIFVLFHPVISLKQKTVIGWEGLIRGINETTQEIISPLDLFKEAHEKEKIVELDRLCRKKIFQDFYYLHNTYPNKFLFLNFDSSIIDKGVVGSGNIIEKVKENSINPQNIVIEIIESQVKDLLSLKKFVENYRSYGFLIALDDFGTGHSNLERIQLLKPDIIKVDRSIINKIHKEYYKQEILRALVRLSHKIGTIVVVEGVETEEEIITCMELEADLFQGFYFEKPEKKDNLNLSFHEKIEYLYHKFKNRVLETLQNKKFKEIKIENILNNIKESLSLSQIEDFSRILRKVITQYNIIECAYILDENGIQVSDTVFSNSHHQKNLLYQPAVKGTDNSLKDYYLFALSGEKYYITEPYISAATGNLCVTGSTIFKNINYRNVFILCIDIYPNLL